MDPSEHAIRKHSFPQGSISLYAHNTKQPLKVQYNDATRYVVSAPIGIECGCTYVIKARAIRGSVAWIRQIRGNTGALEGGPWPKGCIDVTWEVIASPIRTAPPGAQEFTMRYQGE